MLSRVADSLFWMSRYIERAENIARAIDVNLTLTLDLGESMAEQWEPLVHATGDHDAFLKKYGQPTRDNVWAFLTFDPENSNSILSCLRASRENARTVRENLPSVLWEEINKFYLLVRGGATSDALDHASQFLDQVKLSSHLIEGITDANMSQGEAWHFTQMGRLLERGDKTSRILDVKYFILLPSASEVGTPLDVIQWSALLKSASALEMYRKSRGRIVPEHVVDYLVLDREFPRSMHFCLINAESSLHSITGTRIGMFANPAEQHLGQLRSEFNFTHVRDIIDGGLHEFIDRFQAKLNAVGESIQRTFFATHSRDDDSTQTPSPDEPNGMYQSQSSG